MKKTYLTSMTYEQAIITDLVDDGLLNWRQVAMECLSRMPKRSLQKMMKECGWDGPAVD